MKDVIGILGYGGKMGTALCKIIPYDIPLKLGQRHIIEHDKENVEYHKVDIYNKKDMESFTRGITLLINCAGPSMKILDHAANAAIKADISYIDAFGGNILEKKLKEKNIKGNFILNAGSFPGLTGCLPIEMANEYFDYVKKFSLELDNYENWGKASALDLVFSALDQYGKANFFYLNGNVIPCTDTVKVLDNGFIKSEYINQETVSVAKQIGAKEAHFIQIRDSETSGRELQQIIQQYIMNGDISQLEAKLDRKIEEQQSEEYFRIGCYMEGSKDNSPLSVYKELVFPNSYLAGGAVIYHCAKKMLGLKEKGGIGIKSAYEISDCHEILKECEILGAKRKIEIKEEMDEEMEEGDIL